MKLNTSCLFLFLSLLLSLPYPSLSDRCNPNDKKALLQIYKSFNVTLNPNIDCCDDYSVDCDLKTNRIIALTIFSSSSISGQIPLSVGDLPFLQTLVLRKLPNLTGQIPSVIARLTNLQMLRLAWTNLSGPVPPFLSQLKNLNFLDLAFNQLTGSIPPALSLLSNLDAIHLDRNKLTGNIPESFGKFTGKVPELYLSHNQLTGTVPKSLGDLNFTRIDLSRNKLQGDISFLFGANKSLDLADFSRNMFEFDLSKVEFPQSLLSLDLNHNRITGSIPVGLAQLTGQNFFSYLNVSYNRLCGQIPTGGRLQSFDNTVYFHNRCLCGAPLPAC